MTSPTRLSDFWWYVSEQHLPKDVLALQEKWSSLPKVGILRIVMRQHFPEHDGYFCYEAEKDTVSFETVTKFFQIPQEYLDVISSVKADGTRALWFDVVCEHFSRTWRCAYGSGRCGFEGYSAPQECSFQPHDVETGNGSQ